MNIWACLLSISLLCAVGVWADYYLKLAGSGSHFIDIKNFIIGFIIHSSAVIGWFLVLKYVKLIQLGVFYSMSMILLLTALGVFQFGEELGGREITGIVFAITSLILMSKFI